MDPRDLRVTKNANFSLLTHTKQLLLVMFCDLTVGIVKNGMGCRQQTVMTDTVRTDRREG